MIIIKKKISTWLNYPRMTYNMNEVVQKKTKKFLEGEEHNLFLVSTPFQLLGAIEAQHFFQTKNNILVLLYFGGNEKDAQQLVELTKLFNYTELIVFNVINKKKYLNDIISLLKQLKMYSYNYMFVGFFSANLRRFIANVYYQKLYLIDDGVYAASIHREIYDSPNNELYKKYIKRYSEKKRNNFCRQFRFEFYHLYRIIFLWKNGLRNDMNPKELNFFTMFNLPQYQNEIIEKNNFTFMKQRYHSQQLIEEDSVYFLGQPLYKVDNMTLAQYVNVVKSIFNYYKERHLKIKYITHRSENEDVIKEIQSIADIEVLTLPMPIELYLLSNSIKINKLASFVSTGLFSVKTIYPSVDIDAFYFTASNANIKNTNDYLYDIMEKHNIHVIKDYNK